MMIFDVKAPAVKWPAVAAWAIKRLAEQRYSSGLVASAYVDLRTDAIEWKASSEAPLILDDGADAEFQPFDDEEYEISFASVYIHSVYNYRRFI